MVDHMLSLRGLHSFEVRLPVSLSGSRFGQSSPILKPHLLLARPTSVTPSAKLLNVSNTTYHTSSLSHASDHVVLRRLTSIMTSSTIQARQHSGHAHHHHHHDNTYLISTNKKDAGVRITRIGLYVNCLMAIGKGLGGYCLNSQALIADAFHSLTDLVSDILTLGTVSWSLKQPTSKFPDGYGKIESLGSLGVSSLLLAGGIGLGWHSVETLYSQFFLDAAMVAADHGHDHGHGHGGGMFSHSHSHNPADMGIPNVHAAWIAGSSIVVKEYLYRASKSLRFPLRKAMLTNSPGSHENRKRAQIVSPSVQCCPPPHRLPYQHSCSCRHLGLPRIAQRLLARSGWRASRFIDGYKSGVGKYW